MAEVQLSSAQICSLSANGIRSSGSSSWRWTQDMPYYTANICESAMAEFGGILHVTQFADVAKPALLIRVRQAFSPNCDAWNALGSAEHSDGIGEVGTSCIDSVVWFPSKPSYCALEKFEFGIDHRNVKSIVQNGSLPIPRCHIALACGTYQSRFKDKFGDIGVVHYRNQVVTRYEKKYFEKGEIIFKQQKSYRKNAFKNI